jgi:flagellar hook protein FlgE
MFTSIGSLTLHQSYMDVVANNLANVNTAGFKASRVTFMDQISQLMSVGSGPTAQLGGINPTQIGLGVRMGAVTTSFTQGAMQSTGRVTDVALQGDGFFIYRQGTANLYSRDGALSLDADGFLVNGATGMRLQGWQATSVGGGTPTVDTSGPLTDISVPINSSLARATTTATLRGNLDSTTANGGTVNATIGVYDSLGVLQSVNVTFTKTGAGAWSWAATSGSPAVGVGAGTISFDSGGQYTGSTGSITIPGANGAAATAFTLDLSTFTQLANPSDVAISNQDGVPAGSLTGFSVVSNTGEVYGVYSNGLQQLIGQLAVANFVNPSGLEHAGQNTFRLGLNSGTPQVGSAGTGGRGQVLNGYLEASNVDMAQEFTNMILAQRGFQASSRVITTSDEMLQELVNLKR